MNGLLYPLCAGIAWVSLLFKLPALLRRTGGPAAVAVGFFYLFMGVTFTISDPRVWAALDRVTGVSNLSLLLSQGSVIGVAASQLAALTFWARDPDQAHPVVRRQIWGFAAVFLAMAALFTAADLTEEDTTTAAVRFSGQGLYSVYLMLYVTAFAVTEYLIVVRCLRYARAVDGRWLPRGLRLAAIGAGGGLAYVVARYADVLAGPLGVDPQRWELVARLGAGLGGICTLIGWSLPGWGPQLGALRGRWRDYRSYQALYPLWVAVTRANPELALDPGAGRRAVRDLNFRLHRRVIEIQDGLRWLRPAFPSPDETGRRAAVAIAAALRSPGGTMSVWNPDEETDTAWLVRVAQAFDALPKGTAP
ncbi:MAB_1171c family putative transporter [Actinokineospora inagensis]|uniref:MAB_1171c family putative transporter n=1 Tax=Actinokineospora inagensis TaxID=103730 RepID=UPI000404A23A|nr:MAB_1171c family putative transporter [Actinokineospora inagensis]